MIFPDLPKHYTWMQHAPELAQNRTPAVEHTETNAGPCTAKTPLRGPGKITVEEWWIKHGLAEDPAAGPRRMRTESIDYCSRDALEFYALCIGMVCWIVYWYGVHLGAW